MRHYKPTGRPRGRPKKNPPPKICPDTTPFPDGPPTDLRIRDQIVAAKMAAGRSIRESLGAAGYNPSSSTMLKRCAPGGDIHAYAVACLNRAGGTVPQAAKVMASKLKAKETRFFKFNETEHQRQAIKTRQVVDHGIQLDASKEILKIHGAYPKENQVGQPPAGPLAVQVIFESGSSLEDGTRSTLGVRVSFEPSQHGGNGDA